MASDEYTVTVNVECSFDFDLIRREMHDRIAQEIYPLACVQPSPATIDRRPSPSVTSTAESRPMNGDDTTVAPPPWDDAPPSEPLPEFRSVMVRRK